MIDYLVVGSGLAGISFSEIALQNNKSILVFDNNSQNSTRIAGGLYNPVILKRFSEVWQAEEQLAIMNIFFSNLEKKLHCKLNFELPILRKFFSVEEQNNWFTSSDKPALGPFLSTNLISKKIQFINSPYGFGEVLHTGYIDTALLLDTYKKYLKTNDLLVTESFDYNLLEIENDFVKYKNVTAKHIVFAEGFGLHSNPYFNYLPLDGTKGELFIIKCEKLNLVEIINTSLFIVPLGDHLYKVGATYNWKDKTTIPTEEGKQELLEKLKEIINCDFEIIEHLAGVRPTVRDRKPLVGTHKMHKSLHILNGLGTRGVLLGPAMAKALFNHIENKTPLDIYIDIKRFDR